jgi:tRNA U55 pseudouridine synthase TruB
MQYQAPILSAEETEAYQYSLGVACEDSIDPLEYGKKLYELARKGKEIEVQPRHVEIKEFEITANRMPEIDFRVVVSKGTYIRSLAFDFGKALETGACLSALRRTRIGEWKIEQSDTIANWLEKWNNGAFGNMEESIPTQE